MLNIFICEDICTCMLKYMTWFQWILMNMDRPYFFIPHVQASYCCFHSYRETPTNNSRQARIKLPKRRRPGFEVKSDVKSPNLGWNICAQFTASTSAWDKWGPAMCWMIYYEHPRINAVGRWNWIFRVKLGTIKKLDVHGSSNYVHPGAYMYISGYLGEHAQSRAFISSDHANTIRLHWHMK